MMNKVPNDIDKKFFHLVLWSGSNDVIKLSSRHKSLITQINCLKIICIKPTQRLQTI